MGLAHGQSVVRFKVSPIDVSHGHPSTLFPRRHLSQLHLEHRDRELFCPIHQRASQRVPKRNHVAVPGHRRFLEPSGFLGRVDVRNLCDLGMFSLPGPYGRPTHILGTMDSADLSCERCRNGQPHS